MTKEQLRKELAKADKKIFWLISNLDKSIFEKHIEREMWKRVIENRDYKSK